MSVPENAEPGSFSGQQQVQLQQSIHLASAIPIKKRRFPVIWTESPPPEQKILSSDVVGDSKNKQECNIPDEGQSVDEGKKYMASPSNSSANKTLPFILKKEIAPENIELGRANIDVLSSKLLETNPSVSSGVIDNFRDKMNILLSEKFSEKGVPERCRSVITKSVKQEGIREKVEGSDRAQLSTSLKNVDLSLRLKDPLVPALKCENSKAVSLKPQKLDPSMLSLGQTKEQIVLHDDSGSAVGNISCQVSANRSNWDLNTTMDAWEGSTNHDAIVPKSVGSAGFSKADICSSVISSSTTTDTFSLSLGKGKHILDDRELSSSNSTLRPHNADVSLELGLTMPFKELDASRMCSSLMDKSASSNSSPHMNLKRVDLSSLNMNKMVKSEPVDENRDCSIGSSSSSNTEPSKIISVKRELANSVSLEISLPSSVSQEKVGHTLIKSEIAEGIQEARKSGNATLTPTVARVMQHQESSASSSALPVPLVHQGSCSSGLPMCSELTTSGHLSSQSQQSFYGKEFYDSNDNRYEQIVSMVSKPVIYKVGNSNLDNGHKSKLAPLEACRSGEIAADDNEKTNISSEIFEEDSLRSDCGSKENRAVQSPKSMGENVCDKEDEEYEDGEVREHLQRLARRDPIVEEKKKENLEPVSSVSRNSQPSVSHDNQNIDASDFEEKVTAKENLDKTCNDMVNNCASISCVQHTEDRTSQKLSGKALEVTDTEKSSMLGVGDVAKNGSSDGLNNGCSGRDNEQCDEEMNKFGNYICPGENDLTCSNAKGSLNGHDAAKHSHGTGNKSRIINLSHTSVATTGKTGSIPSRLLTLRRKQRYSDLDIEFQPRVNRDESYTGGSNKFVKDRVHDQFHRNPRPSFMLGKGRISHRYGSPHNACDSDPEFVPETYNFRSDYRAVRHRHNSNISDDELECSGYGIPQDGGGWVGSGRKTINNGFRSLRNDSRRFSLGDRDGIVTRNIPMLRRIPRNISPSRCNMEDGSNVVGFQHGEKFMHHLADDIIDDPVCNHPQAMYENLDGRLARGNRTFPTLKGYRRIQSKSPDSSETRLSGPWQSPRRRSPNRPPALTQHRSPTLYRVGRMRSPDRACFRDEIAARRRESPSYIARHLNDLRDDSGQECVHPRPANPDRRGSPSRAFPRMTRREALDTREMVDGDEYINGPSHSNKFHELRDDGSIDERRKFVERRGPPRSFHPNYNYGGNNESFPFHDGPRPYRFCPDMDAEFIDRSNAREREFDGRTKHHHPMAETRRVRNIEEPVERAWQDDGFSDTRVKRRRF